jgi:beta-phosphoglucomutase-like phosphatase (HAD superfamily)
MTSRHDLVFLFDVDNTLLDNDLLQNDLFQKLAREFGARARDLYVSIFEELRSN